MSRPPLHGLSGHPLYPIWYQMIRRCERPASPYYYHYGGRGIRVCDRWHDLGMFVADIEDAIGIPERRGKGPGCYSFDRIDNDGNYEPGNVRWATWSEQMRNRRWAHGGPSPYDNNQG